MKKVFINYSWDHDKNTADYVYNKLTAVKSFDVWRDKEKLLGGIEWRRTLRDTIRETDYFICIMSSGSIEGRGVRNVEIRVALEVLEEFPPGEVYLIPTRVDNCTPKFSELAGLNYVDLFPEIDEGMTQLLRALGVPSATASSTVSDQDDAPPGAAHTSANYNVGEGSGSEGFAMAIPVPAFEPAKRNAELPEMMAPTTAAAPKKRHATPMHSYTVGVVDIDLGLSDLAGFIEKLNKVQSFFLFKAPQMPDISNCTKVHGGIRNFAVYKVPETYISLQPQLASDLIACITKWPLAFEEDGLYLYNYFAGGSDVDNRFMFLSADQLEQFSEKAGCSFKQGLVSILVGQLLAYFTKQDYHEETRGCVMDFCDNRSDIVESLRHRMICKECSAQLPKGKLRQALLQLLALDI
jgi:hypothetical protein